MIRLALIGLLLSLVAPSAHGQAPDAASAETMAGLRAGTVPTDTTALTLRQALRVALDESYDLRDVRLDVRTADAQIQEAWGRLYPQVSATGSYTRNVVTANPFAGSDVTGIFSGGGATEWVTFNEQARTDGDPATEPITIDEFRRRQQQGRREAGITPGGGGGNPFGVDNEFLGGLRLRQTIYNGQAFSAVSGAQTLKDLNQRALDREQQLVVDEVKQAYYDALLAREEVTVARQSVDRAESTVRELSAQVRAGTVPKSERLGAEVELANRRTELVQARADYGTALDNLKQAMGIDVGTPLRLAGTLDAETRGEYADLSVEAAVEQAVANRPDLERARLNTELQQVRRNTEAATYLPTVAAVANLNMSGRVPDNRTVTLSDPTDPFEFSTNTRGFFADSYWNPSLSAGIELSWTLFDGFQRRSRVQQQTVAVQRAELQATRLRQAVRLEVQRALRTLDAARQRIASQEANLETAQTNYDFARRRLQEGATRPLQVREASRQLDQSRLNYLRAVRDYLRAKSAFETALGQSSDATARPSVR